MENVEIYWQLLTILYVTADIMSKGYLLYRFARPFMIHPQRAVFVGAAYSIVMLLLYFMPAVMGNFVAYSVGILVSLLVMYQMDNRNLCQKIFIAVTFFSLRWLSAYMTMTLCGRLFQEAIEQPYFISQPYLQLMVYWMISCFDLILHFTIMGLSVKYIVSSYGYKRDTMRVREMVMLILPSLAAMMEYGVIQYYQNSLEAEMGNNVPGLFGVLAFLYFGISIVTIIVVIVLFQKTKAGQEEKLQKELLAVQVADIKQQIKQVERLYGNIRSVKHDMKNHIMTLERLYAADKGEEARAYQCRLKTMFDEVTGDVQSGNPVTDVILQGWKNEAEKRSISFQSDFYYPVPSCLDVFDVSVILNNALQNASEHAAEAVEPYIMISSYQRNNAYIIEVCNSFTGELQWDMEQGLPISMKKEEGKQNGYKAHGYGLANIRAVAGKYSGDFDIVLQDAKFCLSIMLMLE